MNLETKIRSFLNPEEKPKTEEESAVSEASYPGFGRSNETEPPMQGSSEKPEINQLIKGAGSDASIKAGSATTLAAGSGPMDKTNPKQGSSQDAEKEELDKDAPGKTASAKAKKAPTLTGKGAGNATNYTTVADPTSVVNQPSSKGNVAREQVEADMKSLFGEENLSEDFKTKAASLFEAIVTARVADLREQIETEAAQSAAQIIEEFKTDMIEKVDAYMNYVAEQWLKQNEVNVVENLRADVTEDFINGLKNLFAENYIEVPEDKYDLVGEMATKIEELEASVNEQMETSIALANELNGLKRSTVIAQVTEGLAKTEAEKFTSLIEDVSFEDEKSFAEKLNVLKGNYFPNAPITEAVEPATEEAATEVETDSNVMKYVKAMGRTSFSK